MLARSLSLIFDTMPIISFRSTFLDSCCTFCRSMFLSRDLRLEMDCNSLAMMGSFKELKEGILLLIERKPDRQSHFITPETNIMGKIKCRFVIQREVDRGSSKFIIQADDAIKAKDGISVVVMSPVGMTSFAIPGADVRTASIKPSQSWELLYVLMDLIKPCDH